MLSECSQRYFREEEILRDGSRRAPSGDISPMVSNINIHNKKRTYFLFIRAVISWMKRKIAVESDRETIAEGEL